MNLRFFCEKCGYLEKTEPVDGFSDRYYTKCKHCSDTIDDLRALNEQLADALEEAINDTEVYMPEDWWERARAALKAYEAAK